MVRRQLAGLTIINGSLGGRQPLKYFHVCCWEHQEIRTKVAEYVRVKVVEAVHGQAKVARRVEVSEVLLELDGTGISRRWVAPRSILMSMEEGRLSVGPASVNTGEGACNQKLSGMDMGVGGSEYGGREGVVELMWFTGGRSQQTRGPTAISVRARVVSPTGTTGWMHVPQEEDFGQGLEEPEQQGLFTTKSNNKRGDQKQETEASIGGWQFLQGVL
ncbi:hypothetical protein BY996DRAFT_6482064 [Phakopsora pachyrhizi]|nr:hypothetical protein BY996DRAFT_6482064 [Phakopsora pachyrhizi]